MRKGWFDRNKSREVLIFRAETIDGPGTQTWADKSARPRECLQECRAMIDTFADHRTNETKIINTISHVWEKIAHRDSAFSSRSEFPGRLHQRTGFVFIIEGKRTLERQRLPVIADQSLLRIERIDRRWSAVHK